MNTEFLKDNIEIAFETEGANFENWLTQEINTYLIECQQTQSMPSLEAFLLQYNCLELPLEEHNDLRAVRLLKKWEIEWLRRASSKNPQLAYSILQQKEKVDEKMDIKIELVSNIERLK